jgi:hypothetical protein
MVRSGEENRRADCLLHRPCAVQARRGFLPVQSAIAAFFSLSNRMANMISMRPNDEFYLLGRLPREKKPAA